jgi:hypothetical protein
MSRCSAALRSAPLIRASRWVSRPSGQKYEGGRKLRSIPGTAGAGTTDLRAIVDSLVGAPFSYLVLRRGK